MHGWYKGYLYKLLLVHVMAISIISVSSDSLEESILTSTGRVILFESDPSEDPSEDPSSDHISPLPATSPFLSSTDESSNNDIPDTPPSPTYCTLFTEATLSTQRPPAASGKFQRRVMVLAPRQPIPHGRPNRYHLNGPVHMMTARKRFGPLSTHRLAVRHSVDYSSSYHFASNDSSSSSSSETSSDSSTDALSDSASIPSIPRSSTAIFARPSHDSSSVSPSRKRRRSPTASVPLTSHIPEALSYARADLLPSPKRIRSSKFATDLKGCLEDRFKPSRLRVTNLEMDIDVVRSDGIDIDPEIQAEINECFAYADAFRDKGIDARVVVEAVDRDEIKTAEGAVEVTYDTLGDLVQRIVATRQQSTDMLERIGEIERVNMRLKDMIDVASQRVTRSQHRELCVQRELRQIWRFRFYDRMRIARLEACARRHLGYRALGTREAVNEQINHRLAGALGVHDAARNLEPLMRNGRNGNRGNGNRGNGNGNGNEGGNGYNFRGFMPAREGTYQDFLKCQPLSFNGTEGVVVLTRCALTWWNSQKRTIRIEAAYAISWAELVKLMKKVYCPRNEVQKMETELWNLAVKGNDVTTYTRRFQELVLLCTRMVPNEEDKFERFVRGLPENIQRNVIAAEPSKHQDAIHIANNLMDQKLKGYARSAGNKRRLENNPRDNRGQQPVFKRKDCPRLRNQNRGNQTRNKNGNKIGNQTGGNEATARAYAIGGGGANPDFNVIMGTFLLNSCYASILFDSGANRNFMSSTFSALLNVAPSTLDTSYAIERADGRILETNVILRSCMLRLLGRSFDIEIMPIELGNFNVIIGMDWLAKYHTLIVCDEKVVRIPYGDKVLIIRGDDCDGENRGQVRGEATEVVSIIQEFPDVFPEDLPGMPPARQVKFQIDLVPSVAPVTQAPYQLASAEMQELSTQLQELFRFYLRIVTGSEPGHLTLKYFGNSHAFIFEGNI
nr:reverse transcriptase domain-containing protein [Tanacetum cinerariifolium]